MDHSKHVVIDGEVRQLTAAPCHKHGDDQRLYVVATINNYARYQRRYELFWKFKAHMEANPHVVLYVVEIALGNRPFAVTSADNPRHLQLRTTDEIWHKENSLNLLVQRLPPGWKYLAWIDADIQFVNENWATETIHQLQTYRIVQMFSNVVNQGPSGDIDSSHKGFFYQYVRGAPFPYGHKQGRYELWHPGFAYACTKSAYNDMGGLLDFAILGAGDHHMALAWIGRAECSIPGGVHPQYRKRILDYQERCERSIQRNVGYVPGLILHGWHGKFRDRRYQERWKILIDTKYDPDTDIKRDWQGLYAFDKPKPALRDGIRGYMRSRNEDSVDTDRS